MKTPIRTYDLVLVRSDAGDGGWSLHATGSTSQQIAEGEAPPLVSGTAALRDPDDHNSWDAPTQKDYDRANNAQRTVSIY